MASSPLQELQDLFGEWLARYRLARALRWSGKGLAVGAGLAFLLGAALTWLRLVLPAELAWLVGILLLSGSGVGLLSGLLWPVPRLPAARRFDRQFGLQERLSTALELADAPAASSLAPLQLADTLETARKVDLTQVLPLRLPWRSLAAAVVLCALTAGMAWGLRSQFESARQQRELEAAITTEAEALEELSTEIEQLDSLAPEAEAAIQESLQATIQDLEAAGTLEEALAVLAEGQAELRAQISPDSQATLEALALAGQALSQSENPDLQTAGEALAQLGLAEAAAALENLDLEGLSAEELAQLSDQLAAAAQALQSSQPETAAALQNAADAAAAAAAAASAAQSGDPGQPGQGEQADQAAQAAAAQAAEAAAQAASAVLDQAAAGLQSLEGQLAAGQAAMQAANSLAQAQAALAQARAALGGAGAGTGLSASGQPGAGRGEGGAGEGGTGPEAGTMPIQAGNGPGDGGLTPYESLYVPQRLGGEGGPDVNLPGGDTPGETVVGSQERPTGDPGSLQVPYVDALPYYSEINQHAIDSGQVPLDLRELVRRYFSSLEP